MEKLKYQFVDYQLSDVQKDQVARWVEIGSSNPVGVFGASAELFIYALQAGELPPYEAFGHAVLDWQKKIARSGKHLYYVTPIFKGVERVNAPLARKLVDNYGEGFNTKQITSYELSAKRTRSVAVDYANEMAMADFFVREFGVFRDDTDIWAITALLFPNLAKSIGEPATFDPYFVGYDKNSLRDRAEVDKTFTLEQVENKLATALRRRGILWYYNDKIFEHEVMLGVESEDEIMILPKRPLNLDVISGIEILGPEERKLLLPG